MSTSFETVSVMRPDEHLPADVLARLRQLLFHELRDGKAVDDERQERKLPRLDLHPRGRNGGSVSTRCGRGLEGTQDLFGS